MMESYDIASRYDDVENWINMVVNSGHDLLFDVETFDHELKEACKKFGFPFESLHSFLSHLHLKHIKKKTFVVRNQIKSFVLPEYDRGTSIQKLAQILNFPPSLLSRIIIENISTLSKKKITEALRDPKKKLNSISIILEEHFISEEKYIKQKDMGNGSTTTRLAKEVYEAVDSDPMYGPRFDLQKHRIGIKYEHILEETLRSMKIPFETEDELRKRGTSRTPDILLLSPVAIKVPKSHLMSASNHPITSTTGTLKDEEQEYVWKMICWIDSKALFGDVFTHQNSVLPQAEAYVHRFGPGLVLYWFGHAPIHRLGNGHGDVIVTEWKVPSELLLPTGDVARVGGWTSESIAS